MVQVGEQRMCRSRSTAVLEKAQRARARAAGSRAPRPVKADWTGVQS